VDKISVLISAINLCAMTYMDNVAVSKPIIKHTNCKVQVVRAIANNTDHKLPDIDVCTCKQIFLFVEVVVVAFVAVFVLVVVFVVVFVVDFVAVFVVIFVVVFVVIFVVVFVVARFLLC